MTEASDPAVSEGGSGHRWAARVEGNARLTATTGAVLFLLLAAEGVTVLRIGSLLSAHVVLGMLLVPPILVKIGSTTWKFSRYYLKDPAYRKHGPPVLVLRVLGPFVVVLTVVLFASGIWLLLEPHGLGGRLLLIHRTTFFVWLGATGIHVLGHVIDTVRLVPRDWLARTRSAAPGAGTRCTVLLGSLLAGTLLAWLLVGHVHTYLDVRAFHHFFGPHRSG